ncbi:Sec-independent protein translocase subunit TatA/TatB [Sphingobacterium psychroaquaticum]|uniref:Sec-independent protein translocase protein TatA n=1 Tax=Sphingobacterium psychroaquaticum TaxID=561061 RepID=A0A1X7KPN4_9SPHI|nr:twin-arginine translocase TatA/TatE family subunit [Sphingobacterium psychroaquaticum]QBQ40556.1 twin-arginine translocase TatA/TatE family subunit [Sphingobacterium psychroaquaticum]SMG43510.1 twin arginine-targeting protein translocase, TatA/E family [Sphingobacterium psychroaquaticum]
MTLGFLNIGTQEMIFIVIIILLLFGGKKLPELARGLGKGIREFKDASEGIKREISDQINNFEKDLDVTVEDKPASQQNKSATIAQEINEQKEGEATEGTADEGTEEKKAFPQFSTPDHAVQHNPGQQPGDEHYTYGYQDHFASDKIEDENKETETAKASSEGDQTKNV